MSESRKSNPSAQQDPETVDSNKPGLFTRLRRTATKATAEDHVDVTKNSPDVHVKDQAPDLLARLKNRMTRTRDGLFGSMANMLRGKKAVDDEVLEELETRLLMADVGVEATSAIIHNLTDRVSRRMLTDHDTLVQGIRDEMLQILTPCSRPLEVPAGHGCFVILMVGANGVGKTTTIGKLAKRLQDEGKSVMLAAGDTFRAAAVEQLQAWGLRNRIPVIAQQTGADSASVIFDAVQAARARGIDVLIADTAGRLHTQSNLMEELKKIRRVIRKVDPTAPHETMLVVDAGTGQNALSQASQFHQAIELSGISLTKLDGTAKGGIIFAIAKRMGTPIRFIGVGEGIDDLREFNAEEFVAALLT